MRSVNIFSNDTEKSYDILHTLITKLTYHGFEINKVFSEEADVNICIGGDGSFLRSVHESNYSNIPFVGINTGTLGFFQEILVYQLDNFLLRLKNDDYINKKLYLLRCDVFSKDKQECFYALNEFVVTNSDYSICKIEVYIDGNHLEHFAGDGLIISTPAGSTAYNLSVGGSILYQELQGFQLAPIAPINSQAYRSLFNSLVLSNKETLSLYPSNNSKLVVDGQVKDNNEIDKVVFTMPGKFINKLVFNPDLYWKNLKDKFL